MVRMMVRVTGEFDVTLRTPITVSFDFRESVVGTLQFKVDESEVTLRPLEPKAPFIYEGELSEALC